MLMTMGRGTVKRSIKGGQTIKGNIGESFMSPKGDNQANCAAETKPVTIVQ
jgi:hypothetical protein